MMVLVGVTATIETYEGMSVMERFVAQSLLSLKRLRAAELQEIASIPAELGRWLLECLKQRKLAYEEEADVFEPDVELCTRALQSGRLPVRRPERLDVLWFPETEEAVVIEKAVPLIRQLTNLKPGPSCPWPNTVRGRSRGEILQEVFAAKRLYGQAAQSVCEFDDKMVITQNVCPTYACSALLPVEKGDGWQLVISGERRKKAHSASAGAESNGSDTTEIKLPVPQLKAMVTGYRSRLSHLAEGIIGELTKSYGITTSWDGESSLQGDITEYRAMGLRRNHLLRGLMGLKVRVEDEFEFALPLRLKPLDKGAKDLFAVDAALSAYLANGPSALQSSGVTREVLCDRLWEMRLFKPLYDLREPMDFTP